MNYRLSEVDNLISILDAAIENTEQDMLQLKNTPFAQASVQANIANIKIKKLSLNYINNRKQETVLFNEIENDVDEIVKYFRDKTLEISENIISNLSVLIALIIVILLFLGTGIFVFVFRTLKSIKLSLGAEPKEIQKLTNNIAKGDLSVEFNSEKKLHGVYADVKKLSDKLRKMVSTIEHSAVAVLSASNQLASSSTQISQSAGEQASTSEEIASSMEQMVAMIESNTKMAEDTGKISSDSAKSISRSKQLIISSLESSAEISEKTEIISIIADKTDTLSINAAIEAAKAKEAGKGFAVVADEIRKLSDKTAAASTEIGKLSKTNRMYSKITSKQIEDVIPKIIKSSELVSDIAKASKEQQVGVSAIND